MTEFQILAAIRNNGGHIGYTALLSLGLSDPAPNSQEDKNRIRHLIEQKCISGSAHADSTLRMEPNGTTLLDQHLQQLEKEAKHKAEQSAKQKSDRKFSIILTILSELIAFALGFLTHMLIS